MQTTTDHSPRLYFNNKNQKLSLAKNVKQKYVLYQQI